MITLIPDTKKCMSELLLKNTFDTFSFIEGEITTFNKFTLNGCIQKDFFDAVPDKEYSDWKDLRDFCFSIIKGKRTPLSFRFVFSLAREDIVSYLSEEGLSFPPSDIQGLYLNFRYGNDVQGLCLITGTSMHTFTMDKSLEQSWDKWVQKFFLGRSIPFETV